LVDHIKSLSFDVHQAVILYAFSVKVLKQDSILVWGSRFS